MSEPSVSGPERERLLAEIGREPPPPSTPRAFPAPTPRAFPAPSEPPPPPRRPGLAARAWAGRRTAAGVLMMGAGAAWTATAMASERSAAAVAALLALLAGAWALLRPKKA